MKITNLPHDANSPSNWIGKKLFSQKSNILDHKHIGYTQAGYIPTDIWRKNQQTEMETHDNKIQERERGQEEADTLGDILFLFYITIIVLSVNHKSKFHKSEKCVLRLII